MLVAMGLCLGLLGASASSAGAAIRIVTEETDDNTGDPQPGELRNEITQASPGDTIQIAPGINPKLSPDLGFGDGGQILIDKNLIIEGQGADQTAILVPAFSSRIFVIGSITPAAVVTIRDLRMSGGTAPSGAVGTAPGGTGGIGESGGAILTNANLTLNRVRFTFNFAGNGGAGGVGATSNPGGAGGTGGGGGSGGAILNQVGGNLTVMSSTFDENSAGDGGDGGQGGPGSGGMIQVAGNGGTGGVGQDGGAVYNAGAMTVINSTFRGNEGGEGGDGGDKGATGGFGAGGDGGPGGDGGGINQAGAGSLTLSNVTIADNNAGTGGSPGTGGAGPPPGNPGAEGTGGGTFFNAGPSSIVVANTLYSLNTGMSGSNCAGPFMVTAQGANLAFPAGSGCPASFLNGNPQLSFGNNGGPTPTSALGAGSAAIDAALTGPATDQRGVARPQGVRCDIGAFEREQATIPGSTCAGPPAAPLITPATPLATGPAKKRCRKGRKLKKGRCVKKKRRK